MADWHMFSPRLLLTYTAFLTSRRLLQSHNGTSVPYLDLTEFGLYSPGKDFTLVEPQLTPGIVAFFTPDQIDMFPDGWFDLTQTISTLPEMPAPQAAHYLEVLAAKSRRAVFLKQWRRWRNEADQADLLEEQYLLPAPWQVSERRIDPIQPAFFNQLWLRPGD